MKGERSENEALAGCRTGGHHDVVPAPECIERLSLMCPQLASPLTTDMRSCAGIEQESRHGRVSWSPPRNLEPFDDGGLVTVKCASSRIVHGLYSLRTRLRSAHAERRRPWCGLQRRLAKSTPGKTAMIGKGHACCRTLLPGKVVFRVFRSRRGIRRQGRGAAWSGCDASISRASGGMWISRCDALRPSRRGGAGSLRPPSCRAGMRHHGPNLRRA